MSESPRSSAGTGGRYQGYERLAFDWPEERILRITFDRPERFNALDAIGHRELTYVWREIDADPDVDCVILTGAGKAFFPTELHVCESHYHEFAIPDGAELLASSDVFPHQAMRYGETTFGFQFHAEVTRAGFRHWQNLDWAAYGKPGAQTREQQDRLGARHDAAQHDWFMDFLDRLFGGI